MKHGQKYPRPSLSEMNKLQLNWKYQPSTARTLNGFFRQYGWTTDSFYAAMNDAAPIVYSFQVDVPHSEYGECDWFMPKVLQDWLMDRGLQGHYGSGSSWGNGYTNGVTNRESMYSVKHAQETDALAFQIQFPKCKVHEFKSHDWSKV